MNQHTVIYVSASNGKKSKLFSEKVRDDVQCSFNKLKPKSIFFWGGGGEGMVDLIFFSNLKKILPKWRHLVNLVMGMIAIELNLFVCLFLFCCFCFIKHIK